MKPKTNWNGLTEEAKETFFTFFMWCEFGEDEYGCSRNPCGCCPSGLWCDIMLCRVLFPHMGTSCPCHVYNGDAFPELKQCLIKDGWIED